MTCQALYGSVMMRNHRTGGQRILKADFGSNPPRRTGCAPPASADRTRLAGEEAAKATNKRKRITNQTGPPGLTVWAAQLVLAPSTATSRQNLLACRCCC